MLKNKWIEDELGDYRCSKCGHIVCDEEDVYEGFKYCPECGEKKVKENDETVHHIRYGHRNR